MWLIEDVVTNFKLADEDQRLFKLWRLLFGTYLCIYAVLMYPFSIEMYSSAGVFQDNSLLPWRSFFPSWLLAFDSPILVKVYFGIYFLGAIGLALGVQTRIFAMVVWLLSVWLFNRNPFSDSPEVGFVNWLLLALVVSPDGNVNSTHSALKQAGLITLAGAYCYAGSMKLLLGDASWIDGTALYHILTNDNASFPWVRGFAERLPDLLIRMTTHGLLGIQIGAPLFIILPKTKKIWWWATTAMHLSALAWANIHQLTLGMLLFHFFVAEKSWLSFSAGPLVRRYSLGQPD